MKSIRKVTALSSVAATTTSAPIDIRYANKVSILLTRAAHTSGNHVFTVTASLDGTTYFAFNKLLKNLANAITEGETRVGSVTLSSNTSELVSLDMGVDIFHYIKITATETTDGTATAVVLIEEEV